MDSNDGARLARLRKRGRWPAYQCTSIRTRVFPPLIHLLNSVPHSNDAYLPGQTATPLLGHEAEMDSKMDKIGRSGGHSSSRKSNYSHRKCDQQGDGSRTNHNSNNNNNGGGNWNWRKQQPQQQQGKQQQGSYPNNKYVDFSSPVSGVYFVGGRLSLILDAWRSITGDQLILDIIESGYHIEFTQPPLQDKWPSEIVMDEEKSSICNTDVNALFSKSAIVVTPDNNGFLTTLFP
ncbi:hypothetical protein OUZ56_024405 [Daphnia magna]|uniref:Uncharacterized protein n=1 Tax=Daphnia magna TaxID=35525 RepID=A0ABR0B0W9_9CRUS|nr:hypothetical protein OUZ56_024405 [Daphnia magna]